MAAKRSAGASSSACARSRRCSTRRSRFPGPKWRFGLDALFGLVPGLGDIAGALVAVFALRVARNLNAPSAIQLHMLSNIALDAVIGMVPILGDLFDFAFKAQTRNLALLDAWVATPHKPRAAAGAACCSSPSPSSPCSPRSPHSESGCSTC